jgi:hypothetical protein
MNKPAIIPTYGTDSLLIAGPQVGLSARLDPGAGVRAQGFYQDRKIPARALGWMLGVIGDWITYFSAQQIKTWKLEQTDFLSSITDLPIAGFPNSPGMVWIPEPGDAQGFWYVYGASVGAANSQALRFPRIGTGTTFQPPCDALGNVIANADWSIMLAIGRDNGTTLVEVYKTTTRASSAWVAVSVGGLPHVGAPNPVLGFSPISSLFLGIDGSAPEHFLTSPDGVTWTDRGAIPGAGGSDRVKRFVRGGSTDIVIMTSGKVVISTNGGLTWATTTATGVTDAAYASAWGWLVNISGVLSIVNSLWTTFSSTGFAASKLKDIASDGASRFVWSNYDTTATPGPGIYYSDDGGLTANFVRFSANVETNYIPYRVAWSGEQWGVFGFPTTQTAKYGWWTTAKL